MARARPAALLEMLLAACVAVGVTGCDGDDPVGPDTGLAGTVVRGPTQPVCRQDDPCEDEPFAALFQVRRAGVIVAQFQSDEAGEFSVALAPGDYIVVPDSTAPILFPEQQSKDVNVGPIGFTEIVLTFDTGIR